MNVQVPPVPRQAVPQLTVPLIGGGSWSLDKAKGNALTLLAFYRGWHCPICRDQLRDLQSRLYDFERFDTQVLALSCDIQSRAESTKKDWMLERLTIGYGLSLDKAREWGLYISTMRGKTSLGIDEPEKFSEPGLFLIKPDQTLYYASIQSAPFARPRVDDVLRAIEFVTKNDYPARGEVISA